MNRYAKKLNLSKATRFSNSHGLPDKGNTSTASDIGKIASFAMKEPLFA
jgi:D-alanyl-D-alanine carboxypeptidase